MLEPPSPYLLPLLLFIVLFELALLLGKKQRCKGLALEIKALTLRKFEIAVAMKSVRMCCVCGCHAWVGLTGHDFGLGLFHPPLTAHSPTPLSTHPPTLPQLGIPTDFVKKSKLERELIQLDKDLAPRKETLVAQAALFDSVAAKARYGMYVVLVLGFWGTPLLVMTPAATWPLTSFFSFPRLGAGAVGVSAAIVMVKAAMKPFVPLLSSV